MFQRIQTVYMLISVIITGALPFVFPLWTDNQKNEVFFTSSIIYISLFVLSTVLAIYSIINFMNLYKENVMKIVGLITEYNPFHNGHEYHIKKAKEILGLEV